MPNPVPNVEGVPDPGTDAVPEQPSESGPESGPAAPSGVRVRCDRCGPVIVAVSAVRLLGRSDRWEYTFTCPDCGTRIRRTADPALRAVLRGAGAAELSVQTRTFHNPRRPRDSGPGLL